MLTNAKKFSSIGIYVAGMLVFPVIIILIAAIFNPDSLAAILNGEDVFVTTLALVISYGVLCLVLVILFWRNFADDFKKIQSWGNFTIQMVVGLVGTFAAAIIGNLLVIRLGTTDTALNQQLVEQALNTLPFLMIITVTIFGPIVEEIIFRLVIMDFFKARPVVNLIISSLIFGSLHVLMGGWIHIIPYFLMGLVFGYIYLKNDNIWHATILHILHNGLTVGLVFLSQSLLEIYPG